MAKVKKYSAGGYEDTDDAKNLILAAEREDVERIGEDFAKTLPKPKTPSFKEAFASARKAGDKTFEYMGKKYTTELAKPKSESKTPAGPRASDTGDELSRLLRRSPSPVPRTDLMRTSKGKVSLGEASFKKGGTVGSASRRADGCAQRGKTRGRMV